MILQRRVAHSSVVVALAVIVGGARPAAAGPDADAGTWRMIVLTSPTQISVAAPAPVTGADYHAELTAIKNAQSRLTFKQRRAITHWGQGGVIRWNEILL